jgi:hypothetical protein
LNAAGTDYLADGEFAADELAAGWQGLRSVLEAACYKPTRREILRQWDDAAPPADATLWRWLQWAVHRGLLRQEGSGREHAPFRHWLPDQAERWGNDPLAPLWVRPQDAESAVAGLLEPRRPPVGS